MPLPKIKETIFDVEVPSTKKKVKIRQMKVSDEKILLTARQAGEVADFFKAISQVVNNCLVDKTDVMKMPLFDVEYVFTKIRSLSISNISKVAYVDQEDQETYSFDINLDKIKVVFPEDVSNKIKVNDDVMILLRYPPMELYTSSEFFDLADDKMFDKLIVNCVEKIYEGETVYEIKDFKPDELLEFINSLPAHKYSEMRKFFSEFPSMYNEIEYTNKKGTKRKIVQKTIEDFFTFG